MQVIYNKLFKFINIYRKNEISTRRSERVKLTRLSCNSSPKYSGRSIILTTITDSN